MDRERDVELTQLLKEVRRIEVQSRRLVTERDGRRLPLRLPRRRDRVRRRARVRRGRRPAHGRLERHGAHRPAVRQELRRGARADGALPARPLRVDDGRASEPGRRARPRSRVVRLPRALGDHERRQGRAGRVQPTASTRYVPPEEGPRRTRSASCATASRSAGTSLQTDVAPALEFARARCGGAPCSSSSRTS